ncbi:MAG: hypothetical protein HY840_10430 [Bacteroidetes bacterium]|nr:hypothetical protein [Bacteroidota bacterium]
MIPRSSAAGSFIPVEAGFVNEPHEWRLSSANKDSPVKMDETPHRFYF